MVTLPKRVSSLRWCNNQLITWSQPLIMGIINGSPDSFFRPHQDWVAAVETAAAMVAEGVDILDVGGEATNPSVSLDEAMSLHQELERVIPVIEAIKKRFAVRISVDTSRAAVMQAAVSAGADMINDQRALSGDGALAAVAALEVPVCLMHWFGAERQPGDCDLPTLLLRVQQDLMALVTRATSANIARDRIVIDPGFGQGHYRKNSEENYFLLAQLDAFVSLGYPVLVGWSRKSMIGDVLHLPVEDRLFGSLAAETLAVHHGAAIIRTHDVRAARQAASVAYVCAETFYLR